MEDKYFIPFVNACIKAFSKRVALPLNVSFNYLKKYKGLEFLIQYYPAIHLQSIDDAIDDLLKVCKNNGGAL